MAIQKQELDISFAEGLDQKTDPKRVKPGRFLEMKNRIFNKLGLLEKDYGYAAKGQTVSTPVGSFTFSQIPGTIDAGRNVSSFANELLLGDGQNLFSYAETSNNWVYKGRVELCQATETAIFRNQAVNLVPDSCLNSTLGINVFAWESWTASPFQIALDSSLSGALNGVQISAIDNDTGQTIFNGYLAATTSRPKCVSIGSVIYVLYFSSVNNHLYAQPVTQAGLGTAVDLISDIDTTAPNYDVIVNNNLIYIAYNGTGSTVKVASFNSALAAQATASKSETAGSGVGLFPDTSNNIWVAYNNGSATKAFIMNSALAVTVLAPTVVDNTAAASGVKNVTGVYDGTRGIIFYDKPGNPKVGMPTGDGITNYAVVSSFVQPAVGATVSFNYTGPDVDFSAFSANNSIVYLPTGGYYFITGAMQNSVPSLANLGFAANAAPGATVVPSEQQIIYSTAGFQDSIVTYNTLTAAGSAGTTATFMRSVFLASKAYLIDGVAHVTIGHDSTLQPGYWAAALYNVNSTSPVPPGVCVAKVADQQGGGLPYRSLLPAVNVVSTGIVQFAIPERSGVIERTSNDVSTLSYFLGVTSAGIDYTTSEIDALDLGKNLQISSGMLQMYDGKSAVEQGFNIYPETITAVGATDFGALSVGSYGYKVIYKWTDNLGQPHLSAASPNVTYTIGTAPSTFTGNVTDTSDVITSVSSIADLQVGMRITGTGIPADTFISAILGVNAIMISNAATATNAGVTLTVAAVSAVSLEIPTLRITQKPDATIEIYRTAANGSTYFLINVQYLNYPLENSVVTDSITFTDFIADSSITGNEQIYTSIEVENIAPPAPRAISEYKNRAIIVPSTNPYVYQYSKQVLNGAPVEFSDLFEQNLGTVGGELRGSATLDDKLILLKRNSLYYQTGTGPAPNGTNNDFSEPQFITADTGLEDIRSVVTTPVGIMFKSPKGIYLLDRSLQTKYIGKSVENYNQYTVRGAQLLPTVNQVRFILSNGTALMYNYYWLDNEGIGQWAVRENVSAVSDCIFQNLHTYVTSAGLVYQQNPGSYLDGATPINTSFKTGWFNLAGLQGFERAYFFYLLGKYLSSHTLTVNIYFDYSDTASQTLTITPDSSDIEQWRVFFNEQKCQAFQIEVIEVNPDGGAGFNMSGLNLVVGLKKGYVPIKAASSAS